MTIKVTIDVHAGWRMHVEIIDRFPGRAEPTVTVETVPVLEERLFYIHSTQSSTLYMNVVLRKALSLIGGSE